MTEADFAPIIQSVIAGIGLVLTALIGIYVPKAIAAFTARTGVQVSTQLQATIMGAANTEVGIIQTKLAQGTLTFGQIRTDDPAVLAHAAAAIDRVPDAAAAMNKTVPSMAQTIVGMVGNKTAPTKP
jgi:hypothetical protein